MDISIVIYYNKIHIKKRQNGDIFAVKISIQMINVDSYNVITDLIGEISINRIIDHPSVLKLFRYSSFDFKNKYTILLKHKPHKT